MKTTVKEIGVIIIMQDVEKVRIYLTKIGDVLSDFQIKHDISQTIGGLIKSVYERLEELKKIENVPNGIYFEIAKYLETISEIHDATVKLHRDFNDTEVD